MKKAIFLLSFLFAGISFAQDTIPNKNNNRESRNENRTENRNDRNERPTYYDIKESSDFTFNKQNYRFTPDEKGINISRMENNKEIPVGKLRRTTADGFYIMSSTTDPDDISFGRFDREGNFRTYKYNRAADRVTEEDYYNIMPRDIRGLDKDNKAKERKNNNSNRRNNSNSNNNRNNNNNNGTSNN